MHVPAASKVKVVPLTLQTLGVVEAKLTGRPELAVAASAGVGTPTVGLDGALNVTVMVCACSAAATVMLCDTAVAAA